MNIQCLDRAQLKKRLFIIYIYGATTSNSSFLPLFQNVTNTGYDTFQLWK